MGYTPSGHEALAATGGVGLLGGTFAQSFTVAAVIIVAGVTLIAVSKLFGRIALEPVLTPQSTYRLRVTYNGKPVGARKNGGTRRGH